MPQTTFKLSDTFLEPYKTRKPDFGFNGLGELIYIRTYSRVKEDGTNEQWWETCRRVVEGCYSIQKEHIDRYKLGWNSWKAKVSAQEMYDRMFHMKFLPSGRNLWAMGTPIITEKRLTPALFNCCAISTENIKEDVSFPFIFTFDMLMLGVGVGFDVRGAGKVIVQEQHKNTFNFVIPDSREGWVESLKYLIESFFGKSFTPVFDYSQIRSAGLPLKTFGGLSSGHEPLKYLHEKIISVLSANIGSPISIRTIVDIFNLIAKTVISGNVRRSALLAAGNDDEEFLDLKNHNKFPEREEWSWSSNNSVLATLGMNYEEIAERIRINGEPGLIWLENAHNNRRMGDTNQYIKDDKTIMTNPCLHKDTILFDKNNLHRISYQQEDTLWSSWETGVKSCIKLVSNAGHEIILTPDHKIMLENGNFIEAKDSLNQKIKWGLGNWESNNPIDEDAVLEGFLFGDGFLCGRQQGVGVKITIEKEKEVADLLLKYDFNLEQCGNFYLNRTKLPFNVDFLEKKTFDRSLSDEQFFNDKNYLRSFLIGLYEANGSVNTNSQISLKTTSKKLVQQVQLILSAFGIESWINENKSYTIKWFNGEYTSKVSYNLQIAPRNAMKFHEKIGFLSFYKTKKIKQFSKAYHTSLKVVDIKPVEEPQEVWDFNIEPHYNIANGFVAHNCGEIFLPSAGLCNLVELFPMKHTNLDDFLRSIKFAYLYAKTITLLETHWPQTNSTILRDRRIGTSVSGIAQFLAKYDLKTLKLWLDKGYETIQEYDNIYSDWFTIPRSIRLSTNKPSGSLSLLTGSTPGIHFPESRFYIRRVRLAKQSPLVKSLERAGYIVEPAFGQEESTVVVEFPVDVGEGVRLAKNVSMWEQLSLAAFMQKEWADNSVSVTVTFNPKTEGHDIAKALDFFQYHLKAVSFLPRYESGAYRQMPYEEISEEKYHELLSKLSPIDFTVVPVDDLETEKFCSNDSCAI